MWNIKNCTAYLSDSSIHRNDIDDRLSEAVSPNGSGKAIAAEDVPYPTTDWDLYLPHGCGNVVFTHGKGLPPKPSALPNASFWCFSLEKFLLSDQNSTSREKSPTQGQKARRVEKKDLAHDIMSQISNILSCRWTEMLDVSRKKTLRWTKSSKSRGKRPMHGLNPRKVEFRSYRWSKTTEEAEKSIGRVASLNPIRRGVTCSNGTIQNESGASAAPRRYLSETGVRDNTTKTFSMKRLNQNIAAAHVSNAAARMLSYMDGCELDANLSVCKVKLTTAKASLSNQLHITTVKLGIREQSKALTERIVAMEHTVDACRYTGDASQKEHALAVLKVLEGYGSFARKNVSRKEDDAASLLNNLNSPEVLPHVNALEGLSAKVQLVAQALDDLNLRQLEVDAASGYAQHLEPLPVLKKGVIEVFNTIGSYLESMVAIDAATYTPLLQVYNSIVSDENSKGVSKAKAAPTTISVEPATTEQPAIPASPRTEGGAVTMHVESAS